MPVWLAAPAAAGFLIGALLLHRRLLGWLPEDPPGGRKRHERQVPLCGVVLGGLGTAWLWAGGLHLLAAGAGLCTAFGYLDDRGKERGAGVPWQVKGLLQLAAATLAALGLEGLAGAPLASFLAVVALLAVLTNALNFLDNTDGVAATVGGAGLLAATGAQGPLAAVGFAYLGFLPFNWPRPTLFMGDAGALALGLVLGSAAVERGLAGAAVDWPGLLAPICVPLLDFTQVVLARVWLGYAPWIADRRHITHIANYLGLPRILVAPFLLVLGTGLFLLLDSRSG